MTPKDKRQKVKDITNRCDLRKWMLSIQKHNHTRVFMHIDVEGDDHIEHNIVILITKNAHRLVIERGRQGHDILEE